MLENPVLESAELVKALGDDRAYWARQRNLTLSRERLFPIAWKDLNQTNRRNGHGQEERG